MRNLFRGDFLSRRKNLFQQRLGQKVYDMPGLDHKFLNMKKSFDQVNRILKDFPKGKKK